VTIEVRTARREDDGELARIDAATWTTAVSPAPPPGEQPFFGSRLDPESVLVAQINDQIVGYVALGNSSPLRSRGHVLDVRSIAVSSPAMVVWPAGTLLSATGITLTIAVPSRW
jgi:hypothetical protein